MVSKKIDSKIIFYAILLLALLLRLYHLTSPYLDHHSWRQTQTASIARNLYRGDMNILRPEIDYVGDSPNIAELEFQITPYLTALLYFLFGTQDWVGRVVPIVFSMLSIIYLYELIKLHFNEEVALFSIFFYSILPLSVFFGRVPMPESGMIFFSLACLYHFSSYVKSVNTLDYFLSMIFASLAFLSKLPNLYLILPLLYLCLRKFRLRMFSETWLILLFLVPVGITCSYYAYMHNMSDIANIPYDSLSISQLTTFLTSPSFYLLLMNRFTTVIFTLVGALLFIYGTFFYLREKNKFFLVWLLSVIIYVFISAKLNFIHSYYQLPILPVGSFFIGYMLFRIHHSGYRILVPFLCLAALVLSFIYLYPMYELYGSSALEAGQKIKELDKENSLIIVSPYRDDMMPETFYYADRKGWLIWPGELNVESIKQFSKARYLVLIEGKKVSKEVADFLEGKLVYSGKKVLIFKL